MVKGTPTNLKSFLAAALSSAAVVALSLVARAAAPPPIGSPAPAFSLPVVDNGKGSVSLDQLKGRAIYLNFFATWCVPCKSEAPYIGKLSKQFSKHNVVVIGIDELEMADKARSFAQQYHLPYKIAIDDSGDVGGAYGLIGLPLHVFIAANGRVSSYREGEMSEPQVTAALKKLATSR